MAKKTTPLKEIRSKYGRPETEYWDTGIFLINNILGGGLPTGIFIEFHGEEATGKTTVVCQILLHLIKIHKLKVMYMDVEAALNRSLRENMGLLSYENDDVDLPSFFYACPGTYDEIALTMTRFLESDYYVLVWDSIANSSVGINEDDEEKIISQKLGQDALQQTQLLKAFKNKFARKGKTLIIINQMRAKINLMGPATRGKSIKPAGGKAYDHNLDIRVAITRKDWVLDDNKDRIGSEIAMTTIKNKITFPFKRVDMTLMFGYGINKITTLVSLLEENGWIERAGAYFSIKGVEGSFQGKKGLQDHVRENYNACLKLVGDPVKNVDINNDEIIEDIEIIESDEILSNE